MNAPSDPSAGRLRDWLKAVRTAHHAGPVKRLRRRVRTWLARRAWQEPAAQMPRPVRSRLVASLTTSPDRIVHLERVVRSLLNQSCPPDEIHLNIPHVFRRTGEGYRVPSWCGSIDHRVRLFRVDDVGPATKSLPTIGRFGPEEDVVVVIVDDDVLYLQRMLEVLCHAVARRPDAAHGLAGYDIGPGFTQRFAKQATEVQVLEGWAGIAVNRRAIGSGIEAYFDRAHRARACFSHDDVVFSNWLALQGVPRFRIGDPRASLRMMRARGAQLHYGYLDDALHRAVEGATGIPLLRGQDVEAHLRAEGLWRLVVSG